MTVVGQKARDFLLVAALVIGVSVPARDDLDGVGSCRSGPCNTGISTLVRNVSSIIPAFRTHVVPKSIPTISVVGFSDSAVFEGLVFGFGGIVADVFSNGRFEQLMLGEKAARWRFAEQKTK